MRGGGRSVALRPPPSVSTPSQLFWAVLDWLFWLLWFGLLTATRLLAVGLLVATAVGGLIKTNASIGGAEVDCQGGGWIGLLDGGRQRG